MATFGLSCVAELFTQRALPANVCLRMSQVSNSIQKADTYQKSIQKRGITSLHEQVSKRYETYILNQC